MKLFQRWCCVEKKNQWCFHNPILVHINLKMYKTFAVRDASLKNAKHINIPLHIIYSCITSVIGQPDSNSLWWVFFTINHWQPYNKVPLIIVFWVFGKTFIFPKVSHITILFIKNTEIKRSIQEKNLFRHFKQKDSWLDGWERNSIPPPAEGETSAGCRQAHHLTTTQLLIWNDKSREVRSK